MTASGLEQGWVLVPTDEKETWCLESREKLEAQNGAFFFLNSFWQHRGRRQRRQDAQRGEAWCVEKGLLNGEKGSGRSHLGQP